MSEMVKPVDISEGSVHTILHNAYEGRAKSSVTNRLPLFYLRYILKCFTALEWCVE